MSFVHPQMFSEFLDLSCGRYEPSDDGTRSGIGFGRRFGLWENVAKFFVLVSFVRCKTLIELKFCQPIAVVCAYILYLFQRKRVRNAGRIVNNSTLGCVDTSGAKFKIVFVTPRRVAPSSFLSYLISLNDNTSLHRQSS
jgi:hypothetical protein